jgi:SM-20-related protein
MSDSPRAASPEPLPTTPLAAALREAGWWAGTGLLPDALLEELADACRGLQAAGRLQRAGTGRGTAHGRDTGLRGDSIAWLEDGSSDAADAFLQHMEALRQALNRTLLLGLHELEAHYAVYPPGGGYARHRDRFRDDDARVLSLVVYLNDEWSADDGGALRLHLTGGTQDVLPERGTSVLFLSEEIEHEVLPARRERHSIAGWFRRRG